MRQPELAIQQIRDDSFTVISASWTTSLWQIRDYAVLACFRFTARMISHTVGFATLLGLFAASSVVFTCTLVQITVLRRDPLSSIQRAGGSSSLSHLVQPQARDDHSMSSYPFPE